MAVDLTPKARIEHLRLNEGRLRSDVAEAILGAPSIDLSSSEVSQLSLTIEDHGFRLLRSGLIALKQRLQVLDLDFEIAAIETGGGSGSPVLGLTCRSRQVQKLRRAKGALVRRNISPTDFVELLAKDAKLKVVAETSAKRTQVARTDPKGDPPESSWDTIQRLATELGFWAFEAAGTLYFGRPKWLVKRTRELTVRYPEAAKRGELDTVEVPVCRRSIDADSPASISLQLPYDQAGKVRPGQVLNLLGVPGFGADYIVTSAAFVLDLASPVAIEATTPIDPEPQPPDTAGPGKGSEGGGGGDVVVVLPGGKKSSQGFIWPVSGPITSGFGPRGGGFHAGIDIGVPNGTRCKAAAAGTVTIASVDGDGYGQWVEIDHGGGRRTRYGHFQRTSVRAGSRVSQGQVIGYCDTTGNATGPHLHFEVRVGGSPQNPLNYLP